MVILTYDATPTAIFPTDAMLKNLYTVFRTGFPCCIVYKKFQFKMMTFLCLFKASLYTYRERSLSDE